MLSWTLGFFGSIISGFYAMAVTAVIVVGVLMILGWGVIRILTLVPSILPLKLCSFSSLQCKVISAAVLIIGIILSSTGLYLKGRIDMNLVWEEKQSILTAKIDDSEERAKKEVEALQTEIAKLRSENKNIVQGNLRYVNENFKKYDSSCTVPTDVIVYLNEVSQGIPSSSK